MAKDIIKNVRPELKDQTKTLVKAVEALQAKIEQQLPVYEKLPLAQTAISTQGEHVLKANPAVQEFRATVRDYAAALRSLQEIVDENQSTTSVAGLDDLRSRFNIA